MMITDGAQAMSAPDGALRSLLVFEGQLDLGPVDELAAVPEVNVLLDDLGDPKVPDRLARRFDRFSGSLLPGGRARADDVNHAVDAHSCPPSPMCRSAPIRHGDDLDFTRRGQPASRHR